MSSLTNRLRSACVIALSLVAWAADASGASLKGETLDAYDEYVRGASVLLQRRLNGGSAFLWTDETPDRAVRIRQSQIIVAPAGPQVPVKVPSGLVHDWIGAEFIPNAAIKDVLSVVRNYPRYSEFYGPNVIDSKAIHTTETEDQFSMVLMNKLLFSKIALEGEYQTSYFRMDNRRLYSISRTTRMRQIVEYGTPAQHLLPDDEGMGLIWRIYSVTRLEERNGGVYMEVEVIALSRDIPAAVRLIAEPIVRRVSRSSLVTALRQTRDGVQRILAANRAAQTVQAKRLGSPK